MHARRRRLFRRNAQVEARQPCGATRRSVTSMCHAADCDLTIGSAPGQPFVTCLLRAVVFTDRSCFCVTSVVNLVFGLHGALFHFCLVRGKEIAIAMANPIDFISCLCAAEPKHLRTGTQCLQLFNPFMWKLFIHVELCVLKNRIDQNHGNIFFPRAQHTLGTSLVCV